ncbi:hypothetical protein N8Z02_00525 [Pelagibacteraceae bacterium]|jgi:hypothetical protein|uniref:hypothetical protein n=1 Tax=unclassified Candidatus Pelagibacter TaxID=2647897 RepID=UPI0028FB4DE0|nr:hypothetical protein [Pelagibacteraceae bacterium]|tara:strand:- start:69 stop:548 length:480 start_codon:yes stop_codon:yes gene_type:complete
MKKILGIVFLGMILSGCSINESSLNVGTNFSDYVSSCKKVAFGGPRLVFNDGNLKGYHCEDATSANTMRYEFFENNRLVKVWSRPVSAAEKQARFNNTLLGLAILNSGTTSGTTTQSQQPAGFLSFNLVSGMNRICFYDQMGSMNTKTVSAGEICPLGF